MNNKLITLCVIAFVLLASVPNVHPYDGTGELPPGEPEQYNLTSEQINRFVDEWQDIFLSPEPNNVSNLPSVDQYMNLSQRGKQILVDALLRSLENISSEVYNDIHPNDTSLEDQQNNFDEMAAFLCSFIFDRDSLLEEYNQSSNQTDYGLESDNDVDDSTYAYYESDEQTLSWGSSDTCEYNLGAIQIAAMINDVDTQVCSDITYASPCINDSVSTIEVPGTLEDSFESSFSDGFEPETQELLFHPIFHTARPTLFESDEFHFSDNLESVIGKFISILDALTYGVYVESGDNVSYIKHLTYCLPHRINVDDKLLTGPLGKDVSVRAGLRVIPSIKEKTIFFGVELRVTRLCTLRNRTLPLNIFTFFRIPDSPGGKNDHILILGFSSEKNLFNTEDHIPKSISLGLYVNTRGEVVLDLSTLCAADGVKLIAGIGIRQTDSRGNVGIANFTKIENYFKPAPHKFQIKLDTKTFKFEPLTVTLTTDTPLTLGSQISGEDFGIQMLVSKIEETSTINFSWKNGSLTYETLQPINGTLIQFAGDFKNATLITTDFIGDAEEIILPCPEEDPSGHFMLFGRTVMPMPNSTGFCANLLFQTHISTYLLRYTQNLHGEPFHSPSDYLSIPIIAPSYITQLQSDAAMVGYYLGLVIMAMPSNISLRWHDLKYFTFQMQESLGVFDITFINLSQDSIAWPALGNLVGAQLNQGAKIRFWNVPLENVTINLETRHIHVDLMEQLDMFLYVGATLNDKPLNISGYIGMIPPGDIDIYLNLSTITYTADDTIDLMAAVVQYMGLIAAVGLWSIPKIVSISWDFQKANVSVDTSEDIKKVVFAAAFNYHYMITNNFPPPVTAIKDTSVYIELGSIPSFYINWSKGLEYRGVNENPKANIYFRIIKQDANGNYDSFPLTGYGLTLYTTIFSTSDIWNIKSMAIFGKFKAPTYINYQRKVDNSTQITVYTDQSITEVVVKGRIKFISPGTAASLSTVFTTLPRKIDIQFDKDFNNFEYNASQDTTIDFYMEYGKPSLIAITPNPPLNTLGVRLMYRYGDFAVKSRLQFTIPQTLTIWYNIDKENHIIGMYYTASSTITKGVDFNAYVNEHIGDYYIKDTTLRLSLSNIPTEVFLSSMYHVRGGSMWASISYISNQGIDEIFAGLKRPDEYGVVGWAAYFSLQDIPAQFNLSAGKDGDFPWIDYSAPVSTLDIIMALDGSRFEDLINVPYIEELPYLEINIIDIPAHGLTITYNPAEYSADIRTNNYPTERVGAFTVKFNIVVGGTYYTNEESKWGWSWIGIYFHYWVDLSIQIGIREYILEVKNWNELILDLNAPEITVTINGISTAQFYMSWSIKINFFIDAGLRVGLYLDIDWADVHDKLRFIKIDVDGSLNGYLSIYNYVWDDYWPNNKISLIYLVVIEAGVEYRWPAIHVSINEVSLNGPNTYHWIISPWDVGDLIGLYIIVRYWDQFSSSVGWWWEWWPDF